MFRIALLAATTAAVLWAVLLFTYRFVEPPLSSVMLGYYLGGATIERMWTPIEKISPNLLQAVVMSEDARFCQHRGIDWYAIDAALEKTDEIRFRGASTITMQTVKNLLLWPQPHYLRKAIELPLASLADAWWGKRRVLELYLNVAEWGPGIFGAEAAARWHFSKRSADLTQREAALLAVSLPNPLLRRAGSPGPGTARLAGRLQARMSNARPFLKCLSLPNPVPADTGERGSGRATKSLTRQLP